MPRPRTVPKRRMTPAEIRKHLAEMQPPEVSPGPAAAAPADTPKPPVRPLARTQLITKPIRQQAVEFARHDLGMFARLMNPDPNDPQNPLKSNYQITRFHRLLVDEVQAVEAGDTNKLILNCPPRHGKTEIVSKLSLPWFMGKNPGENAIFGTYSDTFAQDIGRGVRDVFSSPVYQEVFPGVGLRATTTASNRMQLSTGGYAFFVGRRTATTGRGAGLLICDDPIKDAQEAYSPRIRDILWEWFTRTLGSRMMTDKARMILVQTRWHMDDLPGRLTDPNNPHYNPDEANSWRVVDVPALARDDDPLGRKEGEALWPERFGVKFLEDRRRQDPIGFSALYQGRPVPPSGHIFQSTWLHTYQQNELPEDLRFYAASDHAVSMAQRRDKTCMMVAGVDKAGTVWILPELVWRQMPSHQAVDTMLSMQARYSPAIWWTESGVISKSIGPFLRQAMREKGVFINLHEMPVSRDKVTRAGSLQARMAYGQVRFPSFAPWWPEAKTQMLNFPYDSNDDFVDTLAWLGLGIQQQVPLRQAPKQVDRPEGAGFMTLGELKKQTRMRETRLAAALDGF